MIEREKANCVLNEAKHKRRSASTKLFLQNQR